MVIANYLGKNLEYLTLTWFFQVFRGWLPYTFTMIPYDLPRLGRSENHHNLPIDSIIMVYESR